MAGKIATRATGPGDLSEPCFQSPLGSSDRASSAILEVDVQKRFGGRAQPRFLLHVQFLAPPGITILFGASGAGKTTLLNCIAGLVHPDSGYLALGGSTLFDSRTRLDVAPQRRNVGYVFQTLALFPHLSAEENIAYGLVQLAPDERRSRVREILKSFQIANLAARRPEELSGGERQRVALARSLITEPRALLLDEPLSGLDLPTRGTIIADLRAWNAERRIPILYVTHSQRETFALGERVVVLRAGKILTVGTPQEVLHAPEQEMVAQLAGYENIFDAVVVAMHQAQGTMSCRVQEIRNESSADTAVEARVELEVPLGRAQVGSRVRIAIRAGDILVAAALPQNISARNVLPGVIVELRQMGARVAARVQCGVEFRVDLTPGACESLGLKPGSAVWLVVKSHSCQLAASA